MSPFETHREKILGHYSAARTLRDVVLALWNGQAYPVGLSSLTNLDAAHYRAFRDMVDHYHSQGENDPAFMRLADECVARAEKEAAARQRAERLKVWTLDTRWALKQLDLDVGVVEDHSSWFKQRFDAGESPELAAAAWQSRAVSIG